MFYSYNNVESFINKIISDINPYTFTGSAIVIGLLLVNELPVSEQPSVGNFLQLVGLVMQTYASQVDIYQGSDDNGSNRDDSDLESLKNAIDIIKKKLDDIECSCSNDDIKS